MNHYVDVHLRPDPEFSTGLLMSAAFAKLHRLLVRTHSRDVGLSFPESTSGRHVSLGSCMRIHGSEVALQTLMGEDWLVGMRDHTSTGVVAPVPAFAGHQEVRRVQPKSNPERLRRRLIRRKGLSADQARVEIPDSVVEKLNLPYLTIRSESTGQVFRLFISQRSVERPLSGDFNAYGLSLAATVPQF